MKNRQSRILSATHWAIVFIVVLFARTKESARPRSTANEVCVSALLLPFYLQDRRKPINVRFTPLAPAIRDMGVYGCRFG